MSRHFRTFGRLTGIAALLVVLPLGVWWWVSKGLPEVRELLARSALFSQGIAVQPPHQIDNPSVKRFFSEPNERPVYYVWAHGKVLDPQRGGQVDLAPLRHIRSVYGINLDYVSLDGPDVDAIVACQELRKVSFASLRTPSDIWRKLAGLRHLEIVGVTDTELGDAGLAEIARIPSLHALVLEGDCAITAKGLSCLRQARRLRTLAICRTQLSIDALRHIRKLGQLEQLDLESCGLTDQGLEVIESMSSLRNLSVPNNPITDEGLKVIARMKGLSSVRLRHTKITDAGLNAFEDRTEPLIVYVGDTAVTEAGYARFPPAFDPRYAGKAVTLAE